MERGELPCQRLRRLLYAFERPIRVIKPNSPYVTLGQPIQLCCPEMPDLSRFFSDNMRCPEDVNLDAPLQYGLILAATASPWDATAQIENIEDGCGVACTPDRRFAVRNVLIPRGCSSSDRQDYLRFGQNFYLQLNGETNLYLRCETPLLDGQYGPNDHFKLNWNLSKDCYSKWKALHWNRNKRFESEGQPIPLCMRIVMQHIMTGKCLAVENLHWHRSLLGFECGISVHTFHDVHRNETSECIWSMINDGNVIPKDVTSVITCEV